MRFPRTARLAISLLVLSFPRFLGAATITVTTTADSGAGSLRQAILDSNASAGTLDTIEWAVFLLKAKYGSGYLPPPCEGDFADVACPSQFADWIEQLAEEQITSGCDTNPPRYCPLNNNTRGQMAVFLVKTLVLQ